jgi:hypothetical protein
MRRRELQQRMRKNLLWFALGFLIVQLGLAVCVETCWPAVRDPHFDSIRRIIQDRQAETPGRQLFLVVGSSRTLYGVRAERLNQMTGSAGPLVINVSSLGAGPMLERVVLQRLLADGVRPDRVFLEVMPICLSLRDGTPVEERWKNTGVLTLGELTDMCRYSGKPSKLILPWLQNRLLPGLRPHYNWREVMGIDLWVGQDQGYCGRDDYGWSGMTEEFTKEHVEHLTRQAVEQFLSALTQPAAAPGAVQAVRDLTKLCRDNGVAIEFYVPPEGTAFRCHTPAVAESQMNIVRNLAEELGVPLTDGRTWVDDDGFWDGHHPNKKGADQLTERFGREVILPRMEPAPNLVAHETSK